MVSASVEVISEFNDVWNSFLNVVSYCCSTYGLSEMSYVKHGIAVTRLFVKCLIALNKFCGLEK